MRMKPTSELMTRRHLRDGLALMRRMNGLMMGQVLDVINGDERGFADKADQLRQIDIVLEADFGVPAVDREGPLMMARPTNGYPPDA